ncbi:hypothetical protein AOQ84DRAFT_331674 [Glonium stellatum]|uniref:SPIN90/Ldb17 leucine-rich domain-containing protein n=1 Tax=Glonium stellatum TaxID=574774 RepID=A0A8E2FBV5_9PEZI|nr:hypothetical protein AOQ84DRAFT_331674 [Glonium stellatum]
MEFEVSYNLDNEQQFWDELEDIVSASCQTHELIDNALRSYLSFTTKFKSEYLQSEYDIARCTYRLIQGPLFTAHKEYVRRQIVYCLLQEDEISILHLTTVFLLLDGRNDEETFEMMKTEGAFPRLVELIQKNDIQEEPRLHRLLLDLMYEMSRIQRLSWEDLSSVNDAFITYLFQLIEGVSDDVNDPYHYPVIRVLLVLNEQYMVASTSPANRNNAPPPPPMTNRVIKVLSKHGMSYKTFGCNLILLLNRESETSLQLLILKLLYLLFQSRSTAEYFYTNDLHVLLDVILRNLLDLPLDSAPAAALRHTYLRVLHPLLANSQIRRPPYYKRDEILKMLHLLTASGTHFAPVDATTARLAKRCMSVTWLQQIESEPEAHSRSSSHSDADGGTNSPQTPNSSQENAIKNGQRELARRMMGMTVKEGVESANSISEVASHMEKPGVQTPSRGRDN